jgi:hypothetical protein
MNNASISAKRRLIRRQLGHMHKLKGVYQRKFRAYSRMHLLSQVVVCAVSAATVTSLGLREPQSTLALFCSSFVTVATACLAVIDLSHRAHSTQTTYLQLLDLYNSTRNMLFRNNLTSNQYDELLNALNEKTGIILDCALPVSEQSEGELTALERPSLSARDTAATPPRPSLRKSLKVSEVTPVECAQLIDEERGEVRHPVVVSKV